MALANITNNILTDSGIPVTNLTPTTRTLTINGTTYDLSADRSWTIATGVGGSGTTNYLPKFTGASTIGNSIVSESSGIVSVAGRLSASANDFHSFIVDQGTAQIKLERITTSAGLMYIGADNVGFKVFDSGFATRLTLTSGGNLGLGVTPSAWGSGQRALQTPAGAIWNFNASNMSIVQNVFSDGTEKYVNNGFASTYNQNSGQHVWRTAPSGTAGNAISFTQAMTLNASGNLS
jgi:hypothetical protein